MLFVIVFVVGGDFLCFFCVFILSFHFSMNFPVSKQYSPRSNAAVCEVSSEATLFAYVKRKVERTISWLFLSDFKQVISGTFHSYFSFLSGNV